MNQDWSRDRSGAVGLYTIVSVQDDFRRNDRDKDQKKNFWVKDVAGLYGFDPGEGPIELLDKITARSDRTPGRENYASLTEGETWAGYCYAALKSYRENGKSVPYDNGTGRNVSRFGLVAFPEEYRKTSRLTFIVSEQGTIFSKDTQGKPPEEYPEDPVQEGWEVYDSLGPVGEGGVQVSVDSE